MAKTDPIEPEHVEFNLSAEQTEMLNAVHLVRRQFALAYGLEPDPNPVASVLSIASEWCVLAMSYGGGADFARACLEAARAGHVSH